MPIPKPRAGEAKDDFISRCMGNATMVSDFPDQKQRAAICFGSWDDAKKSNASNKLVTRNRMATLEADGTLVRQETLDGRTYVVAPVVALREGVHNGEFISFEELSIFPEVWSGKPLPIDHPKDQEGLPMTANRKDVIESSVVGQFLNVTADEETLSLRGELWIDTGKADTVPGGRESIRRLLDGEKLEVSTAYFTYLDNIAGEWTSPEGEVRKYTSSQFRIGPDHLALLPFDTGACSWEDGCGAPRVNETSDVNNSTPDQDVSFSDMKQIDGKQLGGSLRAALATHDDSDQLSERLAVAAGITSEQFTQLVDGETESAPQSWLTIFAAILETDLEAEPRKDNADDKACSCKGRQNEEGVTIVENISEDAPKFRTAVMKVLEAMGITKTDHEDSSMTTKERVDALISNENTAFTEDHREVLMSMNEDQLTLAELSIPEAKADNEGDQAAAAAANSDNGKDKNQPSGDDKAQPAGLTKEDVASIFNSALEARGITEESMAALTATTAKAKADRSARIQKLVDNSECLFSEEELKGFSDETLTKVETQLSNNAGYWRTGPAGNTRNDDQNTVPEAPAIMTGKPDYNSRIAKGLGLVASEGGN